LDQNLKRLIDELGEAINESLANSEQIAEIVGRIKEGGNEIFLVLQATIGVSQPGDDPAKKQVVATFNAGSDLHFSEQDAKFLKALRIKVQDDANP
jgi:hypothetical protein